MDAKIVIHNSEFVIPDFLAQIAMESPECKKLIFLVLKERPMGAPFGT
jgi:hypothetical protein